jgi:hypothetical protein
VEVVEAVKQHRAQAEQVMAAALVEPVQVGRLVRQQEVSQPEAAVVAVHHLHHSLPALAVTVKLKFGCGNHE